MRPDLFGVIAGVAFVDVINTSWTKPFRSQLSNGKNGAILKADQYRWIRPYSPYDNATAYPNALFLLGSMTHGSVIGSLRSLLQSFVKIGPTTTFYS